MANNVQTAWNCIKLDDINSLITIVPTHVPANSAIPDEKCEIRLLLHAAAAFGAINCFRYLLDKGADISSATQSGFTALHWAAYGGWTNIMIEIISRDFKINTTEKTGQTALHVAAARGHLNAVEFLISHNADLDCLAGFKWTPLHFAVAYGQADVAKYLIKKGAKHGETQVDALGRSADVLAREYKRNWWNNT